MPFLFVDYDQGSGGERFCAGLSQSAECNPLKFTKYDNGRTKVLDVFDQEFLKLNPNPKQIVDETGRYTLVPAHRTTAIAKQLFDNVCTIRIRMPVEAKLFQHIKDQQVNKVFLSKEPTPEYFLGLVKTYAETATDPEFLRKVKFGMRSVEVILLSKGIEPTEKNINKYIEYRRSLPVVEPNIDYDLAIMYEDLVYRPEIVAEQIKTKFGITVVGDWLNTYGQDFK